LVACNSEQQGTCPKFPFEQATPSFPKSSDPDSRRRKQLDSRQHFLKRFPEPHGQRSFLPSFSVSSFSPWTICTPRLTFFSEANPLRRLLIVSKKELFVEILRVHDPPSFPKSRTSDSENPDTNAQQEVRREGDEMTDQTQADTHPQSAEKKAQSVPLSFSVNSA
jgi:hypothetical protein